MPVFEYRCMKCNERFEVLHKSSMNPEKVICPNCSSVEIKKLISSFITSSGSATHFYGENCSKGNCTGNENYPYGCNSGSCGLNNQVKI